MSLGAFAGGVAQGINFGIRNKREMLRAQQEENAMKDDEALRREQDALTAKYFGAAEQSAQGSGQPQVQDASAATAVGGQQGEQPENQQQRRLFNGSLADAMDYATESAKIRMKYGKADPSDMVKMITLKRAVESEGDADAVGLLHVGDIDGALNAYNSTGNERVQLKGEPQRGVYKFAGQELPTVIATVVTPDGRERTINTAQYMTSKIGMDRQLEMLMKSLDMQRDDEYRGSVLGETKRHNMASEGIMKMGSRGDTRGAVGKDYDDLARIYGPEQASQMIGSKYGKKEVSDYQRVQALDKVQGIIDSSGGVVDERNVAQINAMLRSIGEPGYERVEETPAKDGWFKDTPATYKWVPSSANSGGGDNRSSSNIETPGNNNAGNMRVPGSSTEFQKFNTPEESITAIDKQLSIYGKRDGVDTLAGVVSKWSPPNENDTKALIANASKMTGLKPDQKIDLGNPAVRAVITAAIIRQEGSKAYLSGIGKDNGLMDGREVRQHSNNIVAKSGVGAYGKRADGTEKGSGYFGELKMKDGSGRVATEISVGINIDGKEVQIPTLVPTLTEQEKDYLLKGGDPVKSKEIMNKAISFSREKISKGESPFAGENRKHDSKNETVAKQGVSVWNDPNSKWAGNVDIGSVVGKPMAAMGESVGKSVASTISALASIKGALTDAEYQKALAYAQAGSVDIGPIVKQLGVDGFKAWLNSANPAKNTEKYMARTSSNNLNQYFR